MSEHHPWTQPEGAVGGDFHDQAFEPRSSFDFDDELSHFENNMASYNPFNGEQMQLDIPDSMR